MKEFFANKDRKAYFFQALGVGAVWLSLYITDVVKFRGLTSSNFFFYFLMFWFVSSVLQIFAKKPDYRMKWMPLVTMGVIIASTISIWVSQPSFSVEDMREQAREDGFVETAEPPLTVSFWIDASGEHESGVRAYVFEGEKDGKGYYLLAEPYRGLLNYEDKEDSVTANAMRLMEEESGEPTTN